VLSGRTLAPPSMMLRRLTWLLSAVLLLLTVEPAAAQTRREPEATQHALDELANAIAQGKITRTPTPTSTPTATLVPPTATPVPTSVRPTDTPVPTATVEPSLPVPGAGYAFAGYLVPSARARDGLELALAQGRWAIRYDTALCTPPVVWTNVWLALDDESNRLITVERADDAMCAVAQADWTSDVPCAADEEGLCDVGLDGAYPDVVAQVEPTVAPTETTVRVLVTPTAQPTLAAVVAPNSAGPRPVVIVQTVVVLLTPTPSSLPTPTPSSVPTRLALPTSVPVQTAVSTPTLLLFDTPTVEPTNTEVAPVAPELTPTPPPPLLAAEAQEAPSPTPTEWNWPLTLALLAAVIAAAAIWLLVARSGPVMW
jgi:hypothetical protein